MWRRVQRQGWDRNVNGPTKIIWDNTAYKRWWRHVRRLRRRMFLPVWLRKMRRDQIGTILTYAFITGHAHLANYAMLKKFTVWKLIELRCRVRAARDFQLIQEHGVFG